MTQTFIIVGGGHAGAQAVDSLHKQGFKGRLILICDEPYLPYHRPPLSKKFLTGELELDRLMIRHQKFYDQTGTEVRLGVRATAIDAEGRRLRLSDDSELEYDKLLLCLGSRVRLLNAPGVDLPGIHYLRTVDDVRRIRGGFAPGRRMAVIGAGYIGLEVAASARTAGLEVTVLEMADRCMNRVTAPQISEFYRQRHQAAGVEMLFNTSVTGFEGEGRVQLVRSGTGAAVAADLVVVGVGIQPESTLAAAAGLACEDGIFVDEQCRTSDPHIFAAGDCTNHPSARYGRRCRLESVDNAVEQAKVAAANMCGHEVRHEHVPWFWSDQFDIKLQIAGLSQGYDKAVTRGDPAQNRFSVWYLRQGELLAVDAVNSPGDFMHGKKWIAEHKRPDPEKLADAALELKSL
jgi:3-phenylpropionate/trans-cinnamate dioxygenase ferredoxin reductase subunit